MPYGPIDPRAGYHVTPRYLAGATSTGDLALRPLLDRGWHLTHDELGNVYVAAPDHTVRLGHLPEGDDDALWKITAYSGPFAMPRWQVTFQDSAATEIVAGFTTALAAAYADGPDSYLYYGNSNLAALDVGTPLAAVRWGHRYGTADVSFHSPDGLAEVHLRRSRLDHTAEMTGHQERWLTLAGPPHNGGWYATASSFTPEGLVAAMNTALTDPAPVIRYGDNLRHLPPQATAGHRNRGQAQRADTAGRPPRYCSPAGPPLPTTGVLRQSAWPRPLSPAPCRHPGRRDRRPTSRPLRLLSDRWWPATGRAGNPCTARRYRRKEAQQRRPGSRSSTRSLRCGRLPPRPRAGLCQR